MTYQIAIDGPAGSGKSTLANEIAKVLGFVHVDTGALYRTVGLYMFRHGIDPTDEVAVTNALADMHLQMCYENGVQKMYLGEEEVSAQIRTKEISVYASKVSAIGAVRAYLLQTQQDFASCHNVVMDGRDIGTVILPHAQVKLFLTTTPEECAKRRYLEFLAQGKSTTYEEVLEDQRKRDYADATRATAPLKPAPDAVLFDTTALDIPGATAAALAIIAEKQKVLSV